MVLHENPRWARGSEKRCMLSSLLHCKSSSNVKVNPIILWIGYNLFQRIFPSNSRHLRWGWVFLEQMRILNGIKFTTHFKDFLVVETKRFVNSTISVILTCQTCGQRSSRAAQSKHRALGSYFSDEFAIRFYIFNIKMNRRLRSRSVHIFGTCVWRTAAQWQNPIFPASKQVFYIYICIYIYINIYIYIYIYK